VSEIAPVSTEVAMSGPSRALDDTSLVAEKRATTVALDFGRITIDEQVAVYLFGTPGQARFWFMWDRLARGAFGAVVLVDVRRLADCFAPLDYLERAGLPHVVCVNRFDGTLVYPEQELRHALALGDEVPLLSCDARVRAGAKQVLIALVAHVARRRGVPGPSGSVPVRAPGSVPGSVPVSVARPVGRYI
jgi:signal recognition particle receptor subunit beta